MTLKGDVKKDINNDPYASVPGVVISPDAGFQTDASPPVTPGHQRYYCEKCHAPYELPQHTTSWRCTSCHTYNSITPPECPCCIVS
mmetsp:Transcript_23239/g.22300  ORF Transcript_23239/g.22300 Transcript_23239/m.22300 type:complete len:86 (-) Transcript_23239:202-459(-)